MPDQIIDELMADLSGAELKVLLYVVRRTFGFGKDADAISVSQMADGITKKDGTVLDRGTGLARSSIRKATAALVEKGILTVRQVQDESGEYESNVYALRMRRVDRKSDHLLVEVGQKSDHPSPKIDQGVVRESDPQETVVQETVQQEIVHSIEFVPAPDDPERVAAAIAQVAAELRDDAPPGASARRAW
ncbi:MAG: replication protein, partial [Actinomycetota bacterium]|nr:replication protein [Actinomycetota bacterium]